MFLRSSDFLMIPAERFIEDPSFPIPTLSTVWVCMSSSSRTAPRRCVAWRCWHKHWCCLLDLLQHRSALQPLSSHLSPILPLLQSSRRLNKCAQNLARIWQRMKRLASRTATLLLHHCPLAANQVVDLLRVPTVLQKSVLDGTVSVHSVGICDEVLVRPFALQTPRRLGSSNFCCVLPGLSRRRGPFARPFLLRTFFFCWLGMSCGRPSCLCTGSTTGGLVDRFVLSPDGSQTLLRPCWLTSASAFPCLSYCVAQRRESMLGVRSVHHSFPATELHAFEHDVHQKASRALIDGSLDRTSQLEVQDARQKHKRNWRCALAPQSLDSQLGAGCSVCILLLPAAQIPAGTLVSRFTSLSQTSWTITAHAVAIPCTS